MAKWKTVSFRPNKTLQGTNCDVCRRRRRDNFLRNEQSLRQVERDRQRSRRQALGTHLWIKVISNANKTLLLFQNCRSLFFRAHLEDESVAQRTVFRTILMYGFHACVRIFGCGGVRDTQCGFKVSSLIYWNCNLPTIWPNVLQTIRVSIWLALVYLAFIFDQIVTRSCQTMTGAGKA